MALISLMQEVYCKSGEITKATSLAQRAASIWQKIGYERDAQDALRLVSGAKLSQSCQNQA
jgi:hypothetical protein